MLRQVLWYDVTDNKGAYLQLDPRMTPLSTFGQAPPAPATPASMVGKQERQETPGV